MPVEINRLGRIVRHGQGSGQDGLRRGQLANGYGEDMIGVRGGELPVDLPVVLAVVTDEQPSNVREFFGQPDEGRLLVIAPAAKPPLIGGSPVGEQ